MKVVFFLLMLLSLSVKAAVTPATKIQPEGSVTFACWAYTDNSYEGKPGKGGKYITDNPAVSSHVEIQRTDKGYTVTAEELFDKPQILTNPTMKQLGRFAGNKTSMIFKFNNDAGDPYFVWYIAPDDSPTTTFNRVVTIAQCDTE